MPNLILKLKINDCGPHYPSFQMNVTPFHPFKPLDYPTTLDVSNWVCIIKVLLYFFLHPRYLNIYLSNKLKSFDLRGIASDTIVRAQSGLLCTVNLETQTQTTWVKLVKSNVLEIILAILPLTANPDNEVNFNKKGYHTFTTFFWQWRACHFQRSKLCFEANKNLCSVSLSLILWKVTLLALSICNLKATIANWKFCNTC